MRGDLEVEWGGSLSDSASGVVVRTVAWAEVTTGVVARIGDWDASEMRADAKADKKFLVLASLGVSFLVSEAADVDLGHISDLLRTPVPDKKRLSSPLHSHRSSLGHTSQLDLRRSHRQDILSSAHHHHVLMRIRRHSRTSQRAQRSRVQVRRSALGATVGMLLLKIAAVAVRLSVAGLDVIVRFHVIGRSAHGELEGSARHL